MKTSTKFFTTNGGGKIAYFADVAVGAKIGVIVLHGIAEHKGRYADFMARLRAAGFSVFAPDVRGHGESFGRRGDVEKFQDYLSDLNEFIARERAENPKLKLVLFGHSMGGLIAAAAAGRGARIDALILSSPALQRRPILSVLKFVPDFILRNVRIKKYWSESPRMMKVAREDPLGVMRFTLRLVKESFVVGVEAARKNIKNISVPVLITGGVGDKVGGGLENIIKGFGGADKSIRIYDKAIHRVVQNAAADEAIPDIIDWINAKL